MDMHSLAMAITTGNGWTTLPGLFCMTLNAKGAHAHWHGVDQVLFASDTLYDDLQSIFHTQVTVAGSAKPALLNLESRPLTSRTLQTLARPLHLQRSIGSSNWLYSSPYTFRDVREGYLFFHISLMSIPLATGECQVKETEVKEWQVPGPGSLCRNQQGREAKRDTGYTSRSLITTKRQRSWGERGRQRSTEWSSILKRR